MDGDWSVANEDTEASKGPGGTLLGRRTFLSVHTYGDAYGPYRKPADRQARSAAGLATKEKEPGTRVHQPVKPALPQFRKSSQSPTPPPFPGPDTSSQNLGPDSSSQIPGPDSSSQILLSGARPDFEGRTHTGGSQGVCADDPEPELQPVPPHLPADTGASQANARGESSSEADTGGSPRHRTASQGEVPGGPTSVEATSSGSQSTPVQDSRAKLLQPESVTGRPVPAHSSKGSGENEASGSARAMAWAGDAERLQGDVPDVKMAGRSDSRHLQDERRSLEKLELMEDGVIGAALRVKQRQLAREEWLEAKRTKMELQQQAVERSKQQDEVWILDARKRCHMKQREHERMVDKYEEGLTGTKGQRQRLERQAKRRGRKGVYGSVNVSSFSKSLAADVSAGAAMFIFGTHS
eukprot:gene6249-7493_t